MQPACRILILHSSVQAHQPLRTMVSTVLWRQLTEEPLVSPCSSEAKCL